MLRGNVFVIYSSQFSYSSLFSFARLNEIKFNSVDRAGGKRPGYHHHPIHTRERTAAAKVVNGGNGVHESGSANVVSGGGNGGSIAMITGKKMTNDSTRYSNDELVQELLKTVLDEGGAEEGADGPISGNDTPFNGTGALELYVAKDGSATIRSRQSASDEGAVKVATTKNGKTRKPVR